MTMCSYSLPKHPSTAHSQLTLGCSDKGTHNEAKCCMRKIKSPGEPPPGATQVKPAHNQMENVTDPFAKVRHFSDLCKLFAQLLLLFPE